LPLGSLGALPYLVTALRHPLLSGRHVFRFTSGSPLLVRVLAGVSPQPQLSSVHSLRIVNPSPSWTRGGIYSLHLLSLGLVGSYGRPRPSARPPAHPSVWAAWSGPVRSMGRGPRSMVPTDDLNLCLTGKADVNSYRGSTNHYSYSKSNLIMLVEEGQSMYNQMHTQENQIKQNVMGVAGIGSTKLLVRNEFSPNYHSSNSSQLFETPVRKERHNKAMPFGSPKKGISSPEFWACAVASADEIEKKLKGRPNIQPDDLADVVRCLDFLTSSQQMLIHPMFVQ
ncbi:hypothetical protein ZOSMA_3108G00010, partial [Zostera marina]